MTMAEWVVGLAAGSALAGGTLTIVGWIGILSYGLSEHPAQDRLNRLCTVGAVAFVLMAIVATAAIIIAGGVGPAAWLVGAATAIMGAAIAVVTIARIVDRPTTR